MNKNSTFLPTKHFAITKSDSTKFHKPTRVYVGGTGNVNCVDWGTGTTVLYTAVPAGTILPVLVEQILSTSTTATLMVGTY
jgi:hypothetical protein